MKRICLLLPLLWLILPRAVSAGNDILITCNSSGCTKSSNLPLFTESNVYPGFSRTQTFSVKNSRDTTCNVSFRPGTSIVSDLNSQINLNINGFDYYLSELLNPLYPAVSLGHINQGVRQNYPFTLSLLKTAGNNYQNQTSVIDFNFNIECDDSPSIPATPINPSSPDPLCTNSVPLAPTDFSATRNSTGSVTLHWNHSPSPHTGYLIAYGPSPGNYLYGAPDIGNSDFYTVLGLTYGAQYCFYVRTLNGCMPGDRTSEYCINPQSTLVGTTVPAPGFQPNILGVTSTAPDETIESQVLGAAVQQNVLSPKIFFLISLLLLLLLALLISRVFTKRRS